MPTWTYDASGLDDSKLFQVRWLVADTDTNDQLAQDAEINFALSEAANNVYRAASTVCNAIALRYGREMDAKGETQFLAKEKHDQYKQMAADLLEKSRTMGGGSIQLFAGGLSRSGKLTNRNDSDLVQPAFRTDLHQLDDNNQSTSTVLSSEDA